MEQVHYKYNKKTRNIKIINSYLITSKKEMIDFIHTLPLDKVERSEKSCLNEWIAHNRLYRLGIFKKHSIDCDLTYKESVLRRIGYFILSRFYRK